MNKSVLRGVEPEKVMCYFEKISQIPRGSGNEKQISQYIYEWACKKGYEAYQDEALNVIIKKPATSGYENSEVIMLQAHMDMVCEKNSDSNHDFLKDPILLKIEGDFISSAVGTTLGADNGIGVAYCMAILEEENVKHPPLEILITTEEESTFNGAMSVSPELFKAKKLINLDQAEEDRILAGSCGGSGVKVMRPLNYESITSGSGYKGFHVKVSGLTGGHSGEDINKGHGSAISLLVRLLYEMKRKYKIRLADIYAGTSRLAISREAEAVIFIGPDRVQEVEDTIAEMKNIFKTEYKGISNDLKIEFKENDSMDSKIITEQDFDKIIQFLYLFPDGIKNMNGAVPGVVESSINLGILRFEDGYLKVEAELRGAFDSTCQHIKNQLINLSEVFGAEIKFFSEYPAWSYNTESIVREKAIVVFKEEFSRELKPIVVHAGIECGCLLRSMPWLDAIAIGPNCWGFHSPSERMSASSVKIIWQFLKKLLEELK
nr:beta-Ala-His dipeptidase [uncultured Aminipila sp.]